ncbi:intron encoded putative GIY-YIG endonuclease [Bodo saltans virus]|uniref:Intron encoded putative GIY-YIG endonuclease n=1 Tax=Bodo saltans virus TaxID=2024608 RepID=A0A2H4UUB8_9VIRU|nr:intron encoded putative GIY-YIG endonuclease [Bodo saltans virus]ATZ80520.1 intron encoded putative GIY-YIG endonuclease [Bodo saltans virus]
MSRQCCIYKITNMVNNKIYIGKTVEYKNGKKYSIDGRLKSHFYCALKGNGCPALSNAINKYGKDKFIIEKLEDTNSDNVDEREIFYIKEYNSRDKNIGYNIAVGGKGRVPNAISISYCRKYRFDTCRNKQKEKILPKNIREVYNRIDGSVVGYSVEIRVNKKTIFKSFQSTKESLDILLNKAIEYKQEIIDQNKIIEKPKKTYVRAQKINDLPTNIYEVFVKKNEQNIFAGYEVRMIINDKKYRKKFMSIQNKTCEELLKEAIECRDDIFKEAENVNNASGKLPKYIRAIKKNNEITGYEVYIRFIPARKTFSLLSQQSESLKSLLQQAIEYKNNMLQTLSKND